MDPGRNYWVSRRDASLRGRGILGDLVLRELKKASSVWVHEQVQVRSFARQVGYATFNVSPTTRQAVRKYIFHQEDHHRAKP